MLQRVLGEAENCLELKLSQCLFAIDQKSMVFRGMMVALKCCTICYYTPWRVVSHLLPKIPATLPEAECRGGCGRGRGDKCDATRQGV